MKLFFLMIFGDGGYLCELGLLSDFCDLLHPTSFFRKLASLEALSEAGSSRLSGCSEANMSDLESDEPEEEAM